MLHQLVEYARTHGLCPEPGFKTKQARWALVFSNSGQFLSVIELGDSSQKRNPGQTFTKCPDFSFSEMRAAGETKSHFLLETTGVVALFLTDQADTKTKQKHAYFVRLLREASQAMPELKGIADTLEDPNSLQKIKEELTNKRAKPTDKVTLAIQGASPQFVVESDRWHDWWRTFRANLAPARAVRRRASPGQTRCLITGQAVEPLRVHPKIKGLEDVGGIRSGDAIVSFKQESFCSYGFAQGWNAAMSEQAAIAYRDALNRLLTEHSQKLAGTKVVHWFEKKVSQVDDPLSWIQDPPDTAELNAQQRARELLESIRTGKQPDLADNLYYAMTLSGASGRVMVRDWMEGQFEELVRNVGKWFEDFSIVSRDGRSLAPAPKFMAIMGGLARDLDDLPHPLVAKMWRVAVCCEPIPNAAHALALMRARVDFIKNEPHNHARMGLLKAFHIRKGGVPMSPYLNEDHPHPAYHCGRLMAVLADLQHRALGDVGAGIVQRFYAAASSTPALVLGRLVRTSQFHLSKLEPGLARWFEGRIASIWAKIKDAPPRTLTLEEQSLFALGYYQQIAADRSGKPQE